jgi:hypothetical protein
MSTKTETAITPEMNLTMKLALVMSKIERVAKTGKNNFFNYEFASYDDFADMVRVALAEAGVAFLPSMTTIERTTVTIQNNKTSTLTVVNYDFTFADGCSERTYHWQGEAIDNSDKGLGKATTAAIKTFLKATFLISTGEKEPDEDGEIIEERGDGKISTLGTPKGRAVKVYTIDGIREQVGFLYANDFEFDNSIKKHTSGDSPLILDNDNSTVAASKLVAYKAQQKFGMSKDDIAAALEMTYGDWLRLHNGSGHQEAWNIFQAGHDGKVATPKA